jgi:hypothetical protein
MWLCAVLGVLPFAIASANNYELAVCKAYKTEQEINACLHGFAGVNDESSGEETEPDGESVGAWVMLEPALNTRGESYLRAQTTSLSVVKDDFEREVRPVMEIRCEADRFTAMIHWKVYLGLKQKKVAFTRPGRGPVARNWSYTNDGESSYLSKRTGGWLMWVLKNSKSATFTVEADSGQTFEAEFALDGMREIYETLSSQCESGFVEPRRN